MGGNGALCVDDIFPADLSVTADVLTQREVIQVKRQVDEVLLSRLFQHGDTNEELIVFEGVETLHALAEVVELVKIGEMVSQEAHLLRPIDFCHKGSLRRIVSLNRMYFGQLCKQLALADREVYVDLVIGVFDSDFDHT